MPHLGVGSGIGDSAAEGADNSIYTIRYACECLQCGVHIDLAQPSQHMAEATTHSLDLPCQRPAACRRPP